MGEVPDGEIIEDVFNPANHLGTRDAEVFQAKSHFVKDIAPDDLLVRVLENRPDGLGDLCEREGGWVLAVYENTAVELATLVRPRNEAINAADKGGFAAAA